MRHSFLLGIPILLFSLALIGAAACYQPESPDTDSDGMMDAYELFFGLNPANPADANLDYDGDRLSNLRESAQLTDPFAPDTDRDEFNDDVDASPISRAYIQWGAPQFTTGDQYDYAHPDWFLAAYKNGGEWSCETLDILVPSEAWSTNIINVIQSAWHVASTEPPGVGSLSIDLDRTILTNNLRYAVHYFDTGNSSLYVDLLDTNGAVVAENLFGNLLTGSNATWHVVIPAEAGIQPTNAVLLLEIPTTIFPDAAVIHLRRGVGEVTVYEGLIYIDEDGDGLDNEQERQLGTSDYCVDTDGDGFSDYDEVFIYHTDPCKPDKDKDGDKDGDEDKDGNGIIYVDQARGNDTFTGRAPAISGKKQGPKKTIHKGMIAVDEDGAAMMVIKSGVYNENLDIRGKNLKVVIEGNVRL